MLQRMFFVMDEKRVPVLTRFRVQLASIDHHTIFTVSLSKQYYVARMS